MRCASKARGGTTSACIACTARCGSTSRGAPAGACPGAFCSRSSADGWLFRFRMYYGPDLTSLALTAWCEARGIHLRYIQPGKPSQNAFIERFNRTYRTEILDAYVFASLAEVRELTSAWLYRYNTQRPHDSVGRVPPLTYRPRPTALPESTSELST